MIPTLLLLGLVLGFVPHRLLVGAVIAVLWGIGVGEILGGTALAAANLAVGALVAAPFRFWARSVDL